MVLGMATIGGETLGCPSYGVRQSSLADDGFDSRHPLCS